MRFRRSTDHRGHPYLRYPFCFFSEASLPSSVSSTRVGCVYTMEFPAGNRPRACRTPLVLSSDLTFTSADVDGVGSMMDGMTIVPSVQSVYSLGSGTAPTPTSLVSDARESSFVPLRSGGSRGDTISVLSALTAPAALTGRSMFGGPLGGVEVDVLVALHLSFHHLTWRSSVRTLMVSGAEWMG